MIKSETVTLDGRAFIHTWSDEGLLLTWEGAEVDEEDGTPLQTIDEAYDPADLAEPRTYIETDQPIPTPAPSPDELAQAARIMLGM